MKIALFLVGLAAAGAAYLTQEGPPFGPPGGGFPGGGPQEGFGPPGGGNLVMGLLRSNDVRTELKLTDEQNQSIDEIGRELQQAIRAVFENGLGNEPPGPESFERLRAQIDGAAKKFEDRAIALLTPDQGKRFSQLRLQREGATGLLREETATALKLTDEQKGKLREILAGNNPFLSPEERERMDKDASAVLTADQQKSLSELKGSAFAFAQQEGPGGFGPPGMGRGFGPPGMGGPGGMMGQERKLVAQFDKDGNGWLNKEERAEARRNSANNGGRPGGFGGPPGGRGREEPATPGAKISPSDVTPATGDLYDSSIVRTIFLNFESDDWEAEMEAFNNTDVEVPATMIVDGKELKDVGVHFRGMSSFAMVGSGHKRSLNISTDFIHEDQELYGYSTLNLLNAHEDPSFLHTVLYFDVARKYLAAPKANFVRVVINGENWGLYTNAQQFNKTFLKENYGSSKGTRWKVSGSPQGRGGLEYLGDDISQYQRIYSMKSNDDQDAWKKLASFCKVLNETPADQLEEALKPILDIDEALWFLALENALINSDGYWIRASDYCIFLDGSDKFHIIPHDANETFSPGMGPGMMGGGRGGRGFGGGFGGGGPGGGGRGQRPPVEGEEGRPPQQGPPRDGGQNAEGRPPGGPEGRGGEGRGRGFGGGVGGPGGPGGGFGGGVQGSTGVNMDPLIGLNDTTKPLRSKLLAVPSLRKRYLSFVRTIAEDDLNWERLGKTVEQYATLISPFLEADTKKLTSFDAFKTAVSGDATPTAAAPQEGGGGPGFGPMGGRGPRLSIRQFADQRSQFLLNHDEIKTLSRVDFKRPEPKKDEKKSDKK